MLTSPQSCGICISLLEVDILEILPPVVVIPGALRHISIFPHGPLDGHFGFFNLLLQVYTCVYTSVS